MQDAEREVWDAVEALNRCWTAGDPAELRDHFHASMVAITPGDRAPVVGREACVAAWSAYARSTRIISWQTRQPRVRVYERAAVVTYLYEMVCERDNREFHPAGRDMMVLVQEGGRWWAVADHFSPDPGAPDL